MRLITHNMLQCHVKGCNKDNFPLRLEEVSVDQSEDNACEFNADFIKHMMPKIDWPALRDTTHAVCGFVMLALIAEVPVNGGHFLRPSRLFFIHQHPFDGA